MDGKSQVEFKQRLDLLKRTGCLSSTSMFSSDFSIYGNAPDCESEEQGSIPEVTPRIQSCRGRRVATTAGIAEQAADGI
jgi:hypothetical protein